MYFGADKRSVCRNLVGYCVGNLVGPQVWQAKYAPRNYVPWGIVLASYTICPILLWIIRTMLVRENMRRDRAKLDKMQAGEHHEEVVEVKNADGTVTVQAVDVNFLDLTDKQNQDFRYCL